MNRLQISASNDSLPNGSVAKLCKVCVVDSPDIDMMENSDRMRAGGRVSALFSNPH